MPRGYHGAVPEDSTPPSQRPIFAFFDVDNTLMRGTSLFHLGREAWSRKIIGWRDISVFALQQRHFISKGENVEHLASAKERGLGLAAGRSQADVRQLADHIWNHRIRHRLYPGAVELTQSHIAKGHEVWIVSATPVEIGDVIAHRLGLTGALGTVLETIDGVYTGNLIGHVMHAERKAEAADAMARQAGADLADCWAYSDSRNDIPLLELVGNPTVVNPDAALARHAAVHDWPVLRLDAKSIREAARRVRREARAVRRRARREPGGNEKSVPPEG